MTKGVFVILGWFAFGLGLIGVVLPVLPTTPFMILAAFFFAKGSPRARAWLVERTVFGPHIENWEASGAIARKAKIMALTAMCAVVALSIFLQLPFMVIAVQVSLILPAALYVWTRPEPEGSA
jgi:uncharacterized membrane protein YbaN (DUF454 family)